MYCARASKGTAMVRSVWKGLIAQVAVVLPVSFSAAGELPGVSDTEIRIGNIAPYTGPASAWSTIAQTLVSYFEMINDQGGVNGRAIRFVSYDDGYNPPRALEAARRLVERDDVLLIFQSVGAPNLAIRDYLNSLGVPQLFMAANLETFDDPANYPWTMRYNNSATSEAKAIAEYVRDSFPDGKIGILYENGDWGSEIMPVFEAELGDFVAVSYDLTDPTVDTQVSRLQSAGVDIFIDISNPRFAALAIRRAAEIEWHPHHILTYVSATIKEVFQPAGAANAAGIVTMAFQKDLADPGVQNDPDVLAFNHFWETYHPGTGNPGGMEVYAFHVGAALVEVLRRCGDDLTRENVMWEASHLDSLELPLLLPGITVNTSPTDYAPLEQYRLSRFDGKTFVDFGPIIDTADD